MVRSIDHIVIAVRDLTQASADYERAGFTVTPGGEHAGGATHNALVSFADGAYFELIAFKEPDRPQAHRWWSKLEKGEGPTDFALLSDGLAVEADRLRRADFQTDGPRDGGRLRPDGRRIAWRTLGLEDPAVPLPFLIEDETAREFRVPAGAATKHRLGVDRVAGLTILVADLARASRDYEALLGTTGTTSDAGIDGVRQAKRFRLGSQWIELAEPAADAAELRRYAEERGAGPYQIDLAGPGVETGRVLPLETTHGARIRIEA